MYVLIEVTREKVVKIFHNENDLEIYLEINRIKTQNFNHNTTLTWNNLTAIKDCPWKVINTCELFIDDRNRYSVICIPTVKI